MQPSLSKEICVISVNQVWPLVMVPLAESCQPPTREAGLLSGGLGLEIITKVIFKTQQSS